MKKLFTLLVLLVAIVTGAWANGTITAAATTDLGSGNTPRYVVEQAGVGRLMKNKTGSSSWSFSSGALATGSSLFALQTYNDISAIIINGSGTSNNRTFSKLEVGTTTSNYAEVTATGEGTMNSGSAGSITITPNSTIAANSYVAISLSGNINITSVELVYAPATAPDAPSFSPNGGAVNGGSSVTLTGDAKTVYYQWSTNASAEFTPASEGWTEGTTAMVPNENSTYYLYAYASNGSSLNSSVVKSEAFTVTAMDLTTATISWAFDDQGSTLAPVLSDGSDLITSGTVTIGSNLAFEANGDHCYVDSEGQDDVTVSRIKPSATTENELIFNITLKDGVTFIPTNVSFVGMKQGTNGDVKLDAKWYEEGTTDITLLSGQNLKRASSSGTYNTPGGDRFSIAMGDKVSNASSGTTGLKLVLTTSGKSYGIGEIKITGTFIGTPYVPTETYTVTFNAGENGTCTTTSLTEESAGAGVTLPAVTANEGYQFNGWFTAATEGTKVGDAGDIYNPSADVEIFAQYLQPSAPTSVTISGAPTAAVVLNQVVKLTATVEGAVPDATVDWLDESDNVLASATTTYTVPTTALGSVKVKARATNESGSVSSDLVTINVIDPNKTIEANEYFISVGEQVYPDEKITGTDIALTFVNGKAGESFTAGVSDNMISGENSKYVASISGSQSNNGWKAKFEPTADGVLKVGVVINNKKTFSITPAANVTSFSYKGKNNADPQVAVGETVEGNSLTTGDATTDKIYVEVTLNVEANKEYSFSVAGSKMGFYGFTFTPASIDLTINAAAGATTVYSDYALDFSTLTNVKAYIEKGTGDKLSWTQVTSAPAKTGLLVVSSETALQVPTAASSETDVTGNRLKGVATGESKDVTAGDNIYIFTLHDGKPGFIKSETGRSLLVGKAYLDLGEEATGAREFFDLFEDGTTTGISSIDNDQLTTDNDAPAYNLAGQKVGKGYKGIVIINGKKVVK